MAVEVPVGPIPPAAGEPFPEPPADPRRSTRSTATGVALAVVGAVAIWVALDPAGSATAVIKVPIVLAGVTAIYKGSQRVAGPGVDIGLWFCTFWIVALVAAAVFADVLPFGNHHDVSAASLEPGNQRPDLLSGHPLGTNNFGLDILSRAVYAARVSLLTALVAVVLSMVVGGSIGLVAGYFRGRIDTAVSVFTDSLLAFPAIVLLIAIASIVGTPTTVSSAIITEGTALALVGIPAMVRLARSSTMVCAQQDYVIASRSMGSGTWRILTRDIVPNVVLPLVAYGFIIVAVLIVADGSLAFLGLGLQQPQPTWGNMIAEGTLRVTMQTPHIPLVPGVFMFLTVFAFNRIGDRLRQTWEGGEHAPPG